MPPFLSLAIKGLILWKGSQLKIYYQGLIVLCTYLKSQRNYLNNIWFQYTIATTIMMANYNNGC